MSCAVVAGGRHRVYVVTFAAALALVACGHKGAPLAPSLVQPRPVEELGGVATAGGVRLSWIRPTEYAGGKKMNDLGGFTIERSSAEEGPPKFVRIGSVEVTDQDRFRKERHIQWIDANVTPGGHYLYRVTAYTLDGYRSSPTGPVEVRYGPGIKEPLPKEQPRKEQSR